MNPIKRQFSKVFLYEIRERISLDGGLQQFMNGVFCF